MRNKATAIIAVMVVLAATVFLIGDARQLNACSTAEAALAHADCAAACEKAAAAVTANAHACCKATIASVMAACNKSATKTASTDKAAGAAKCSKSAHATSAKIEAITANAADCCKKTVAEFLAAVQADVSVAYDKNVKANTGTKHACSKSASSAALAGTKSGCSKSASTAALAGTKSGCSKGASAAALAGTKSGCSKSSASAAEFASIPYHETKRVVLKGEAKCGKCTMNLTEACETVFKTADGKFYRLLKSPRVDKLREAESDKGFKIVTRVRRLDGVKYLELESFRTL